MTERSVQIWFQNRCVDAGAKRKMTQIGKANMGLQTCEDKTNGKEEH